jgi:uncharacterized repeat protein (TIGR03843 family)
MGDALALLAAGDVTVKGRIRWSSNATYLVEVTRGADRARAVYKPARGERPLWDFPPDLYRREVAAYLLSEALGWGLVPPTVARDGPHGEGSLQLFVDADFERHYFTFREDPAHRDRLQRICAFDVVANNADRKGGHCLLAHDGTVWAIDNALTFHVEPKLRTVIWDFGGERVPDAIVSDVAALAARGVPAELDALLDGNERRALRGRMRALVRSRTFPVDRHGRSYPWPLV